jgi:hypothetical protein
LSAVYQAPVADPFLLERDYWLAVRGFRLVSVDGPWPGNPGVTLCTFEDDEAPEGLAGLIVIPVFSRTETPDGPLVTVMSREAACQCAGGCGGRHGWIRCLAPAAFRWYGALRADGGCVAVCPACCERWAAGGGPPPDRIEPI